MAPKANSEAAAVGFRVKSGWAAAVLLAGPASSPCVCESRKVLLSDPVVPQTIQPYHVALRTPGPNTAKIVERLTKQVASAAKDSVASLLGDCRQAGHGVRGAALVVGSMIDPASIGNEHIRAHALEGRLFRTALADALRAHRIPCFVVVEKNAYATAAKALNRSEGNVKAAVNALGDSVSGPWRAEEKLAALVAWMALAKRG